MYSRSTRPMMALYYFFFFYLHASRHAIYFIILLLRKKKVYKNVVKLYAYICYDIQTKIKTIAFNNAKPKL